MNEDNYILSIKNIVFNSINEEPNNIIKNAKHK